MHLSVRSVDWSSNTESVVTNLFVGGRGLRHVGGYDEQPLDVLALRERVIEAYLWID